VSCNETLRTEQSVAHSSLTLRGPCAQSSLAHGAPFAQSSLCAQSTAGGLETGLGSECLIAESWGPFPCRATRVACCSSHPHLFGCACARLLCLRRYKHLHGKFAVHPLNQRRIPIICDAELVDMNFGTGAVKASGGLVGSAAASTWRLAPLLALQSRSF